MIMFENGVPYMTENRERRCVKGILEFPVFEYEGVNILPLRMMRWSTCCHHRRPDIYDSFWTALDEGQNIKSLKEGEDYFLIKGEKLDRFEEKYFVEAGRYFDELSRRKRHVYSKIFAYTGKGVEKIVNIDPSPSPYSIRGLELLKKYYFNRSKLDKLELKVMEFYVSDIDSRVSEFHIDNSAFRDVYWDFYDGKEDLNKYWETKHKKNSVLVWYALGIKNSNIANVKMEDGISYDVKIELFGSARIPWINFEKGLDTKNLLFKGFSQDMWEDMMNIKGVSGKDEETLIKAVHMFCLMHRDGILQDVRSKLSGVIARKFEGLARACPKTRRC